METGSSWSIWAAYAAIVVFLLLLLAVFARTMMMFAVLTFMPAARVVRRLGRLLGRRHT